MASGELLTGTRTTDVGAFKGARALLHDTVAGVTSALGLRNFTVPPVGTVPFGRAYIELYVDASAAVHATLSLGGSAGTFSASELPIDGAAGYQRVQVPLWWLRTPGEVGLGAGDLAAIKELRLSSKWAASGVVRADEIRFAW